VKTVALIGYSCSGKTEVAKAIRKAMRDADFRDSDKEVARSVGNGTIASIFMNMERMDALNAIEQAEGAFLDSLQPSPSARLVVCGPNLPLRSQWPGFIARVNPVFYYLHITPQMCYHRLSQRHKSYRKKFPGPRSGSWNAGILCDFIGGKWIDIGRSEALKRIPRLMAQQTAEYTLVADPSKTYATKDIGKETDGFKKLVQSIVDDLGS
jgi:shikimate kinase